MQFLGRAPTRAPAAFKNSGGGKILSGTNGADTEVIKIDSAGRVTFGSLTFVNLGTPGNGTVCYCSDCTGTSTCAGSGTGALAKRINGAWVCN